LGETTIGEEAEHRLAAWIQACTNDRLRNDSDLTVSCGFAGCENLLRQQFQWQ
jgi:hypothetical protein